MKKIQPTLLLVDDDPNDLLLLEMAIGAVGVSARIQQAVGGREAIEYLSGHGRYANRTEFELPDFIITDLKMPGVDGFALLDFLRHRPDLAVIPTVVISGSPDNDDITKSRSLGAISYHVKPSDPFRLRSLVKALLDYWSTCELSDTSSAHSDTHSGFKLGDRYTKPSRTG